jgi:hypothetical protein
MSLAGDISILAEIIEKFLENWEEMSLAGADRGRKNRHIGHFTQGRRAGAARR